MVKTDFLDLIFCTLDNLHVGIVAKGVLYEKPYKTGQKLQVISHVVRKIVQKTCNSPRIQSCCTKNRTKIHHGEHTV